MFETEREAGRGPRSTSGREKEREVLGSRGILSSHRQGVKECSYIKDIGGVKVTNTKVSIAP